jgi:transposase
VGALVARPSKIHDTIIEQLESGAEREVTIPDAIVRALVAGAYIEDAAESVGITSRTVYNWLARGEEHEDQKRVPKAEEPYVQFLHRVTRAKAEAKIWHLANVRRHAAEDWRASKWWLSVVDPDRWSERHRVEHSGAAGVFAPATIDFSALTDEEVEKLEELLSKAEEAPPDAG